MKKVLIIAGEASGDMHGANLVHELAKLDPSIAFSGVGSRCMKDAGVSMLADASEISVVGATEALAHWRPLYRVYRKLTHFLTRERPDLLILIDFPDFNILLGKRAKKLGIPVLYYISPQVWAWRKGRVKTIAKLVKTMIVVFPFEVAVYKSAGVDVRFAGHPLTDVARSAFTQAEAKNHFGLDPGKRTIALMPGSRTREIAHLLPDMLKAADLLNRRFDDLQFILPVAPTLSRDFIKTFLGPGAVPVALSDGRVYDVLRAADAALVTSGTATLETALMTIPMVIVYRVSALSYLIGRMVVEVDHIGLANIVAGKRVVPELIQQEATPANMAEGIAKFLSDPVYYQQTREQLAGIRAQLGQDGASARVASIVREFLLGNRIQSGHSPSP